jgi:hypothetical protein
MKRIENWSIINVGDKKVGETNRLYGIISDYQPYPDGVTMVTSPIYELDFENNLATTLCYSNNNKPIFDTFELGNPNQTWIKWLEETNQTKYFEGGLNKSLPAN